MRSGELFTFVEMSDERGGEWASTNNMIEGGVNARLREMLRMHRGLSTIRRIKAIFWWCYMHTEAPLAPAEILRVMPTAFAFPISGPSSGARSSCHGSVTLLWRVAGSGNSRNRRVPGTRPRTGSAGETERVILS